MWLTRLNITNPEDVLRGAKPNVTVLGPYVYNELSLKHRVSWSDDGDLVHYWDQHYYVFNKEQ